MSQRVYPSCTSFHTKLFYGVCYATEVKIGITEMFFTACRMLFLNILHSVFVKESFHDSLCLRERINDIDFIVTG